MKKTEFHRILVANRGEIALRVIRAIRALDRVAVVVYSDFDKDLPFVKEADEAYSLGSGDLMSTYLDRGKILDIAGNSRVDAIHPGYGFLSEHEEFARECQNQGIRFIGPEPGVIALMGDKSMARKTAKELGIPVLPGIEGDLESLIRRSGEFDYPVLIKPAAGGGGKGMRLVREKKAFEPEARQASLEARRIFGMGDLYVEKYLEGPRHIEVQIIGDQHGNLVHLYERECSLQRRYQKIIEEAPSAALQESSRGTVTSLALKLAKGIGYTSAGTVEFLMDRKGEFYLMEMNTRIQVEHPVTELITGIDLVKEQITISEGNPLSFSQEDVVMKGHAIEARIYAEDPEKEFLPSTGRIQSLEMNHDVDTRVDSGFLEGNLVEPYYDPMLAKVISRGRNREEARKRLINSLKEFRITGLATNRDFLIGLLRSGYFRENDLHTGFLDRSLASLLSSIREAREQVSREHLLLAAAMISLYAEEEKPERRDFPWHLIGHWRLLPEVSLLLDHEHYRIRYSLQKGRERMKLLLNEEHYRMVLERKNGHHYWIRINDQIIKVWGINDRSEIIIDLDGHLFRLRRLDILDRRFIRAGRSPNESGRHPSESGDITAPMNGRVVQVNVREGDRVDEGDPMLVLESMKMENKILAPFQARIKGISISAGEQVSTDQTLIIITPL